ncbi:SCO family protein [Pseudomonas sp. RIT-PI-S]|uniref:SCO family protein n=1 Tax=Pseudomonas sp. RIT-PI-S TaxID=3035295 RepID=UPI0021D880F9|nr:SCO family protein [Pseudomonas sp. RIT-PI-S]
MSRARYLSACGLALALLLPIAAGAVDGKNLSPFAGAGIDDRLGAALPLDAPFTDQHGDAATLRQYSGTLPMIVVPVYFTCPNVCSAQLATLFMLLAALNYQPGRDYQLVAFSFKPEETPTDAAAQLAALARRWPELAHNPAVHFLVGPQGSSAGLAKAMGFRYRFDPQVGEYAHTSAIATVTANGTLARWLYGLGYQASDLRLAVTEAGQGKVGSLGDRLLLLCFHYDPRTGGYDNLVIRMLQAGGVLTCLLLGGGIALAVVRERRRVA